MRRRRRKLRRKGTKRISDFNQVHSFTKIMASQQNDATSKDCKVCFDVFNSNDRRPRSLPCGHTFCSKCISDNLKENKIFCPSCRREHQATNFKDIPVNYVLECMIQEISCGQPSATEDLTPPVDVSRGISKKLKAMRLELSSDMEGNSQEASLQLHMYKSQLMEWKEDHQKTMEKFLAVANRHEELIKHIDKASLRVDEAIQEGEEDRQKMKMAENNLAPSTAHDIIPTLEEADHCYDDLENWTHRVQEQFPDSELISQSVMLRERAKSALQILSVTDENETGEASALSSPSLLNMQETLTRALENAAVYKHAAVQTEVQKFSYVTPLPGRMFESGGARAKITPDQNRSCLSVVDKQLPPGYACPPKVVTAVTKLLGNLTAENLMVSCKSFQRIPISSAECLSGVTDLCYEKAVSVSEMSPSKVKLYAQMCRCLSQMGTADRSGVKFRNLIINKCQREFEHNLSKELEAPAMAEIHACVNPEKFEIKDKLSSEVKHTLQRSLCNIRFIGEFYRIRMVTSPIMMRIIGTLLLKRDERSLECLCELLKIIGKMLETQLSQQPTALEEFEKHFQMLEKIVSESLVDARICGLIKQVINLRKGNWPTYI